MQSRFLTTQIHQAIQPLRTDSASSCSYCLNPIYSKPAPRKHTTHPQYTDKTFISEGSTATMTTSSTNSFGAAGANVSPNGNNARNATEVGSSASEGWYCPVCEDGPMGVWNPCCDSCGYKREQNEADNQSWYCDGCGDGPYGSWNPACAMCGKAKGS